MLLLLSKYGDWGKERYGKGLLKKVDALEFWVRCRACVCVCARVSVLKYVPGSGRGAYVRWHLACTADMCPQP